MRVAAALAWHAAQTACAGALDAAARRYRARRARVTCRAGVIGAAWREKVRRTA
ncbi:hypothetical protein C7S16_7019 [Burkholderia thailandensis]|uniref:Lipoprotein n=1 Tax=Burkholderia thailandensis TaxID=57975 RepID=A0AAW9CQ08_BURTH|nr:hypothetical protein [Burkholderia thailandensis]MDW9251701.1 hypothetical protein [Burkholderia thailandensis]